MNKQIDEYLLFIVMIYVSIDLASMVFAYKSIEISGVTVMASSLIFPLTYSIMDIVAEVYGYRVAKNIIFFAFVSDFIFVWLTLFISYIPSINPQESIAYEQVLGSLLRAVVAQTAGVLVGAIFNIYLISKWKLLWKGQYFWFRSIGSSVAGEALMLTISVLIALAGMLPLNQLVKLIILTFIYKIIFAIVAAPFVSLMATFLKKKVCSVFNEYFITKDESRLSSMDLFPSFPKK